MKKFALILCVSLLVGCHHYGKQKHKKPIKQHVQKTTPQPIQEIEVNIEPKQEIVEPEPFREPKQEIVEPETFRVPEQPESWWF